MSAPVCRDVRAHFPAHLDDELGPVQAGETRAHLADCPACRAEFEALRRTVGALRNLPDLPAPAAILAGVRARLRPRPWYRRLPEGRQWLLGVPVGAVATVLVVIGLSFFQARHPEMQAIVARPPAPTPSAPVATAPRTPATVSEPAARIEQSLARKTDAPEAPPPVVATAKRSDRAAAPVPLASVPRPPAPPPEAAAPVEAPSVPAPAARNEVLPETGAGPEAAVSEDRAAAPSHFLIPAPERAPERTVAVGVGTLEGRPRVVSNLRDEGKEAPATPHFKEVFDKMQRDKIAVQPSTKAPAAGSDYRPLGTTAAAEASLRPGAVTAGATGKDKKIAAPAAAAPFRVVCLLLPGGASADDLARVLRREGAVDVRVAVLERRAVREASAPYRNRVDIIPRISRGWTVTAGVPRWSLAGLLDALAANTGLRVLELPPDVPAQSVLPERLELRVTVLR